MAVKRIFAQLFGGFRFACPNCGELNTIQRGRHQHKRKLRQPWNRISGRTECQYCGKVFYAGLLLWAIVSEPRAKGGHPDQVPTPKELAQLRRENEGIYIPQRKRRRDLINRTFDHEPNDQELEEETPALPKDRRGRIITRETDSYPEE